jgi:hypothetical protein
MCNAQKGLKAGVKQTPESIVKRVASTAIITAAKRTKRLESKGIFDTEGMPDKEIKNLEARVDYARKKAEREAAAQQQYQEAAD